MYETWCRILIIQFYSAAAAYFLFLKNVQTLMDVYVSECEKEGIRAIKYRRQQLSNSMAHLCEEKRKIINLRSPNWIRASSYVIYTTTTLHALLIFKVRLTANTKKKIVKEATQWLWKHELFSFMFSPNKKIVIIKSNFFLIAKNKSIKHHSVNFFMYPAHEELFRVIKNSSHFMTTSTHCGWIKANLWSDKIIFFILTHIVCLLRTNLRQIISRF